MTDDSQTIDIPLSADTLEGSMDQLADELALSESQREEVRAELESIIDARAPDADAEQREAMLQVMATMLRHTVDQLDEPLEAVLEQ